MFESLEVYVNSVSKIKCYDSNYLKVGIKSFFVNFKFLYGMVYDFFIDITTEIGYFMKCASSSLIRGDLLVQLLCNEH